jgi:hypothetical protein
MVERFNGRIEEVLQGTTSDQVKSWRLRCTAMSGFTTTSFRNQL